MEKQKRTSSEDDPSYDSGKRLKASNWKEEQLNHMGIFLSTQPISVDQLTERLKKIEKGVRAIPRSIDLFKKYTKDILNFSLTDINWNPKSTLPLAMKWKEDEKVQDSLTLIRVTNKNMTEFYDRKRNIKNNVQNKDEQNDPNDGKGNDKEDDDSAFFKDRLYNRLFEHWYNSVFMFVTEVKEVLEKLIHPIPVPPHVPRELADKEVLKETVFTHMFMTFSQIFFLNPEVGERRKISLKIRNKVVGCLPDVKFYQHETKAKSPHLLVMLVEVKRDGLAEADDDSPTDSQTPWIQKCLNRHVLGQIGVELMSECWNSAFAPCTLGIVCMRTEIIFMLLESNLDHYEAWMMNKTCDNNKSYIQYTQAFDIMKEKDRNEVMDLLFWLGCVQKGDFEQYFFFGL